MDFTMKEIQSFQAYCSQSPINSAMDIYFIVSTDYYYYKDIICK